ASPGHHAARTPGASMALTPSTTHGGHPASRGASVATTMASSMRLQPLDLALSNQLRARSRSDQRPRYLTSDSGRGQVYGSSPAYLNAGRRMCRVMRGTSPVPSKKLLSWRPTSSALASHFFPSGSF